MQQLKIIARIRSPFGTKFGVPRQSGLSEAKGEIVFEPEFRTPEAVRGLEGFSHIWLIWGFSENEEGKWSPTVRPPRLGGNTRVGVFASRSPFRPNPIGLSCVELIGIEHTEDRGEVLLVSGADLLDGTPIFDIKPYVPYADCRVDARGGFTDESVFHTLKVVVPDALRESMPEGLASALENDPRPAYQDEPERVYGMSYGGREIKFRVDGDTLYILQIRG